MLPVESAYVVGTRAARTALWRSSAITPHLGRKNSAPLEILGIRNGKYLLDYPALSCPPAACLDTRNSIGL